GIEIAAVRPPKSPRREKRSRGDDVLLMCGWCFDTNFDHAEVAASKELTPVTTRRRTAARGFASRRHTATGRRVAISPVFWPETCCPAAQALAGPTVTASSP